MDDNALISLQKDISGYAGKMFRESFGKGPQSVYTSVGYTFITIYLRNFLTPSERVLLEQDQVMTIMQMRDKLMDTLIPELRAFIGISTGKKIQEVYYDWNLHNKSGMVTCISSEPFTSKEVLVEEYIGKEKVDNEVIQISKQAQKIPEEVYSCEINERTLIIIRNGILVRIEKELIRLGHGDLLKRVKRNLEKGYLHNNSQLEANLNKQIIEMFVDWDFDLDKSVILFVLNPTEPKKHSYKQVDIE